MAGIDASIYGQIKPLQLERKENVLAELAGLRAAENQNKLFDMQVADKQRQQEETAGLNRLYQAAMRPDGSLDEKVLLTGAAQNNLGSQIPGLQKKFIELQKARADVGKVEADTKKTGYEAANLALTQHRALLNNVNDPASAKQWLVAAYQHPDTKAIFERMGPMGEALRRFDQSVTDPESFQKWKMGASMNADELVKYTTPDANTVANNKTSTENNKRTVGASYANAAATREIAKATKDAAAMQRDRDTEMKIADDYRAQSKPFKEVGDAYRLINATLDKAATSPAATLAAATKFMKLLDPGSVVRESELGMALQASGVFDRATNYYNVLKLGKVLTPNQVKDFKNITEQIYAAAQAGQKAIDASYTQQAKTYGLRPEMIVQDLGQNAVPAGKPAPNSQAVFDEADAILKGL
jgi:hypothetical protein